MGKILTGRLAGLWSLRFGKYRALYQIRREKLLVLVLRIGYRKNVYE
ncbi:MAG: type II toxin-antitoxin system RelE/ParE family toxin [Nanoarchaeota archaeon]|nr:type II toxin-antitoxin system RelE/ParE family toxin [Nanoarchaeota archaeon]